MRLAANSTGALAAALAVGVAALGAGCGRSGEPDKVKGKELFVQKCGACHTLSHAGTKGVQGPNLDTAFAAARHDGFGEDTIRGVVRDQIRNVRRGSIMPRNLVKGDKATDVAAYVAMVASIPGQDSGALAQAGKPKGSTRTAQEKNGVLEIDSDPSGALAFVVGKATARAGKVQFVMKNGATIQHDIAVKNGGEIGKGPVVGKGGISRFTATLKPGKYEFFCSVPGHEAGGMKGELTVR